MLLLALVLVPAVGAAGAYAGASRRGVWLLTVAAIHLAWPLAIVWLTVPITWLVCLMISYGWIKSGFWKRLEV